ncbi:MarR family winged helix-turn-helix transcriptional regulator [Microbaculum marinisediminis]|uniref:MarR family transcriptional regulator n=1 Tax=Microbaculum marinisediminis TaxID=2931392 RepID=A0AAW5QZL9_9HYPH|nr:MarR family transcriptional regulator [Microbaculum sp. A6E488]MCT8973455.1 MarR family transcriptional regulator [Microbaculum sp. A6E488]
MSEKRPVEHDGAAKVMKSIRRIVRAIDMRSKRVARETGLTIPQIVILQAVRELGEVTTAALSKHADLSAATTVTILDKLESRGLVTRRRSATDRRIVHTALTDDGDRILADAPPLFSEGFSRRFAALSRADQDTVVAAFHTVADLLDPGPIDVDVEAEEARTVPLRS